MVFTRTKLVSYLYFPFISNKRQVKRGNCHTLISSGDLCLVACNFCLVLVRCLAPIIRQFVKFQDMPEIKGPRTKLGYDNNEHIIPAFVRYYMLEYDNGQMQDMSIMRL